MNLSLLARNLLKNVTRHDLTINWWLMVSSVLYPLGGLIGTLILLRPQQLSIPPALMELLLKYQWVIKISMVAYAVLIVFMITVIIKALQLRYDEACRREDHI